jgi:hypothetical protein
MKLIIHRSGLYLKIIEIIAFIELDIRRYISKNNLPIIFTLSSSIAALSIPYSPFFFAGKNGKDD